MDGVMASITKNNIMCVSVYLCRDVRPRSLAFTYFTDNRAKNKLVDEKMKRIDESIQFKTDGR